MLKEIKYISNSIQGHHRDKNQDGTLVIESDIYHLYSVFDGLSSHAYSFKFIDIYKQFLVKNHANYLDSKGNNLNKLIFDAHTDTLKKQIDGLSTISGVFISDDLDHVLYFSIGDSRIYTVTKDSINQITTDDNITMLTHLVTRCLGLPSLTLDDCALFKTEKETNFLLCTDGFYPLMHKDMPNYLQLFRNTNPGKIKTVLFDIQKDSNSDDATYIFVKLV